MSIAQLSSSPGHARVDFKRSNDNIFNKKRQKTIPSKVVDLKKRTLNINYNILFKMFTGFCERSILPSLPPKNK